MDSKLTIQRYPPTQNKSLQAWNASDEFLLNYISENKLKDKKTVIFNDRFGYLGCYLSSSSLIQIVNYKSEEKSLRLNLESNGLTFDQGFVLNSLSEIPKRIELGLIKVPKSIELFDFYLAKLIECMDENGIVLCGFMTKYFNKSILSVAEKYFEEVEQSLAWKKSRILILKKPKQIDKTSFIQPFSFSHSVTGDVEIKQYPGVFSSKNIDQASQFFLDHLGVIESDKKILDMASGNGILGLAAQSINPKAEIHFVDDSYLAIESSKLNIKSENVSFHWNDSLETFDSEFFELVVSNPPFHFEFETNIEISIGLFKQVHHVLKKGGRFRSVASKHLNFKTHLEPLFSSTRIIAETSKFVVYESVK
ncbi:MAG: methyltransferase [Balneolaceae bacterium]